MSIGLRVAALLACSAVARAAWGLDFVPCTEAGQESFECATLEVPVDRSATVPGTIALAVERLPSPDPGRPVLVALAGGPGQSATAFASTFATVLAGVLDRYQLIVFDQRGTGLSGVLDCPALRERFDPDTIAACGTGLGAAARFYTTADSVLDLDDIRAALGVEQVVVAGVSYGTYVGLEYARTFPDRTAALVLDSTVPPNDVSALGVESFAAVPRVLGDICRNQTCGFTSNPVADTAALVGRLVRPLGGIVIDGRGHRKRRTIDAPHLFAIIETGDLSPLLQARYPGAVVAAERGDTAPLLRLAELLALGGAGAAADADPAVRSDSVTLGLATECADIRFPWQEADPVATRSSALGAALAALPAELLQPFDQATAAQSGLAPSCLYWPTTGLARASSPASIPDVPALILTGTRDVRTPLENADDVAALLPRAVRVVVPGHGHSLLTGTICARDALADFLHDLPVGDPCADATPRFATEPPPPKTLRAVAPLGIAGLRGRVIAAVIATLNDAIDSALTVVTEAGKPIGVGGLRAGRVAGTIDAQSLHLALTRYSLVRGVAVTGTIDADAGGTQALAKVRGRAAGKLAFGLDGSIRGRLGGRRIALVRRAGHPRSVIRARTLDLPPIP